MTDDRNFDRMARAWLELGPNEAPDRAVSAVLQAVEATPQVRRLPRFAQRIPPMIRLSLAASVAVAVVILGGVLVFSPRNPSVLGGPSASASATASPTPASATASPTPASATASRTPASPSVSATAATLPNPISVKPEAAVPVTNPEVMVSDGKALWVLTQEGGVVRIDPTTNKADRAIELAGPGYLYNALSAGSDAVWVTRWDPGLVYRIDTTTRAVVAEIPVSSPEGVLPTPDAVWVANASDGTVTRIDPASNQVVTTINVGSIGDHGPTFPASGFGSVWVTVPRDLSVVRIDPSTNKVQATIDLRSLASSYASNGCQGLFATSNAMWMTCESSVIRIDPSTNTAVAEVNLHGVGFFASAVNDAPWVSIKQSGSDQSLIAHVDAATNRVDRVLSPGAKFFGLGDIVVAGGSVWVVDGDSLAAQHVDLLIGTNNQVLRLPLSAFGS